jgi:U3 small nucleolar RNA-associated protein 21
VRCLTGSPALDVVGVGLADGRVLLHNLRFDEVVLSLSDAAGAGAGAGRFARSKSALSAPARGGGSVGITCLSFSSGPGLPLLAAGGAAGIVALWNLEGRCLHALLRDAHDRALLSLHFFPGEPRLMSSAADNSVKQWVSERMRMCMHESVRVCVCVRAPFMYRKDGAGSEHAVALLASH